VYPTGGSVMVSMTVVMVQMSWAVEMTVIPAVIQPFQRLLLLGHAVKIISVVIMVSYISHIFIIVLGYQDKFQLNAKSAREECSLLECYVMWLL
jgi:hypothetical protein